MTAKQKSVAKSVSNGELVPARNGGKIRHGSKPGNTPGTGRTPEEFKRACQQLASSAERFALAKQVLDDPDTYPSLWLGALKWATEHGYGKPKESVEVTGKDGGPIQIWKIGKKEIRF